MAIQYLQIGLEEDARLGDVSPVNVRMEQLIPENHEFLMQFIDYDLSKAEQPLAEYLTCLDTGKDAKKQLLISAITELQQMHPYFHFCRENAAWLSILVNPEIIPILSGFHSSIIRTRKRPDWY